MATRKSRGSRKSRKSRGSRKGSSWTDSVKRVYAELKRKNSGASLGDAMRRPVADERRAHYKYHK